ncbi:hypothetical protein [Streptomyces mirabilis]|uniref:hypothetical protein n=1 Tax=Streptomyces mirabilis TaxID=68239 RepID=UPI003662970F
MVVERRRRGCVVVPDVVANSATNAWWWVLYGEVTADAATSLAEVRGTREAARELGEARRDVLLHRPGGA